jgi:hypothetical protein
MWKTGYITDAGSDRITDLELNLGDSAFLSQASAAAQSTGNKSTATPTTYGDFVKATGFSGIMTAAEYSQRKSVAGSTASKYASYQAYLAAMYQQYK